MRPIDRGPIPQDNNGNPKTFSKYTQARRDLIIRIGEFCSYCEQGLGASLAIEHIQPKILYPQLKLKWENFLLACQNCNSTKGSKAVTLDHYFWPHKDNTFRAFIYEMGGIINVNPQLSAAEKLKAEGMIALVGLDKIPGDDPEASDRRWENRRQAWEMANRALRRLQRLPYPEMRDSVVDHAIAQGFWSVWMTVFANDANMRQLFIDAFSGTSTDCFDARTNPIPRPNGNL